VTRKQVKLLFQELGLSMACNQSQARLFQECNLVPVHQALSIPIPRLCFPYYPN
jgi:hypothetical protein